MNAHFLNLKHNHYKFTNNKKQTFVKRRNTTFVASLSITLKK